MDPFRVLIVDDQALFREGLKALLQSQDNLQVVGEACDGEQGIAMARELQPNLMLMDIGMDGIDGLTATRIITKEMPGVRVVVLTESEREEDLCQAIKNGAQGYVLKGTDAEQFFCLIEGALAGGTAISGVMAAKLVKKLSSPLSPHTKSPSMKEPLSERELDVLHCLKEGPTNRQIAAKLAISESTVKKHIHRILVKLHLENRSQAAVVAGNAPERIAN